MPTGKSSPPHWTRRLYALDAKTGKTLWTAKNGDPQLGQTMTSAPLVVHDKVIVGIAGESTASAAISLHTT